MTRKLERILIAVDEGSASETAVDQGLALAAGENASVVLAHVVSIPGEKWVPHESVPDRVPDRTQVEVLVEAAAKARAVGVPYTTELLVGYPPKELALVADDLDVDLIVIGSRHLSGMKRFFIGSTSRALIGESKRPMLIVPDVALEPALV
jgi:nucleotide-binding universal stress UspA family protein